MSLAHTLLLMALAMAVPTACWTAAAHPTWPRAVIVLWTGVAGLLLAGACLELPTWTPAVWRNGLVVIVPVLLISAVSASITILDPRYRHEIDNRLVGLCAGSWTGAAAFGFVLLTLPVA